MSVRIFRIVVAMVLCASAKTMRAETSPARVAVYAERGLENETALVAASLSKLENISLIERADLDRLLKEQAFAAAGLTGEAGAVKLGQLLNADAVLWMGDGASAKDITLRVIAVRTGLVLGLETTPRENAPEAALALTGRALPKLSVLPESTWLVTLTAGEDVKHFGSPERELERILALRLAHEPGVFVLERRRLETLVEGEKFAAGPAQSLLGGSCQLEIRVRRDTANPALLAASVVATFRDGSRKSVVASGSTLAELVEPLVQGVLGLFQITPSERRWNAADDQAFFRAKLARLLRGGSAMGSDHFLVGEVAATLAALGASDPGVRQYLNFRPILEAGAKSWDVSGIRDFVLEDPSRVLALAPVVAACLEADISRWTERRKTGVKGYDDWLIREVMSGVIGIFVAADEWGLEDSAEIRRLRSACAAHFAESANEKRLLNHDAGMARLGLLGSRWWKEDFGAFLDTVETTLNEVNRAPGRTPHGVALTQISVEFDRFQPLIPRHLQASASAVFAGRMNEWMVSDNPLLQTLAVRWVSILNPLSLAGEKRDDILVRSLELAVPALANGRFSFGWAKETLAQVGPDGCQRYQETLHRAGLALLASATQSRDLMIFSDPASAEQAAELRAALAAASANFRSPILPELMARLDRDFPVSETGNSQVARFQHVSIPKDSEETIESVSTLSKEELVVTLHGDAWRCVLWNPILQTFQSLGGPPSLPERDDRNLSAPLVAGRNLFFIANITTADGRRFICQYDGASKRWIWHTLAAWKSDTSSTAVLQDRLYIPATYEVPEKKTGLIEVATAGVRFIPLTKDWERGIRRVLADSAKSRILLLNPPKRGISKIMALDPATGAWESDVSPGQTH